MHGRDHVQFVQAAVFDLALLQRFGNHADDPPASCQHGVGNFAHQADLAAAIDQLPAAGADGGAKRARGGGVRRLRAVARTAIDADADEGCGDHRAQVGVIGGNALARSGLTAITSRVPQATSCQYCRSGRNHVSAA